MSIFPLSKYEITLEMMNLINLKLFSNYNTLKFGLTLVFFFAISAALSQNSSIIELNNNAEFSPTGKQLQYYEDKSSSLSIENVVQPNSPVHFKTSKEEILNFSKTKSTFWIKLQIRNRSKQAPYLEIANPTVEDITIYEGSQLIYNAGYDHPYKNRSIRSPFYYVGINADSIGVKTYYIKAKSNFSFQIPIKITYTNPIIEKNHLNDLFFGIYFGAILFAFLYNLLVYLSTKIKSYLYYALFCLFVGLGFGSLRGYSFELWPDYPSLNHLMPVFLTLASLFMHLFSIQFLETHKFVPKFHKILCLNVIVLSFASCFSFFNYYLGDLLMQFLSIYSVIILIITAFSVWIRGNNAIQYFLLSYTQLFIFVLIYILGINKLIPLKSVFIYNYSVYVGSMIQALLLSLALVDRIKYLQKQNREKDAQIITQLQSNDESRIKANQELEAKVVERTQQLKEQSDLLTKKNKKFTDSIAYARKIQQAMLPTTAMLSTIIPKYFIINRPRDIVSGDFFLVFTGQ